MRIKSVKQRYFDFSEPSSLKVVQAYRRKYQTLSGLLDANPELLVLAHRDWANRLSDSQTGRCRGFTSEQLVRSLVVLFVEQLSYRDTIIRIDTSEFLRHFARLGPGSTMDYSLLSKAGKAIAFGHKVLLAQTGEEFIHHYQVMGQRFRAGVEGSISVLKRAFHLGRCLFKGFKNYAATVGLAVLCHNLVLLSRL